MNNSNAFKQSSDTEAFLIVTDNDGNVMMSDALSNRSLIVLHFAKDYGIIYLRQNFFYTNISVNPIYCPPYML